jgi:uncharacterized protein (DUF1697 family)
MTRLLALLRAVNVGGRKLPMAELRELCATIGWQNVATYIQSGNIVFTAAGKPQAIETGLEQAIERRFGLAVPVIVRSGPQWAKLAGSNPFAKAAGEAPNRVQLLVSKRPPAKDAAQRLMERAQAGEAVEAVAGGLWLHFPEGVARSKLTPSAIDKACGSPATGRNYRTVLKLRDMLKTC